MGNRQNEVGKLQPYIFWKLQAISEKSRVWALKSNKNSWSYGQMKFEVFQVFEVFFPKKSKNLQEIFEKSRL